MTEEIKALNCPKCGAPVEFPQDAIEVICPFCGNILTRNNITLVNAKDQGKVIDIGVANIDELHELEQRIGLAKKFQIKYTGHKLLMQTLGENYESFIKNKQIEIKGSNTKIYIIHINGFLEVFKTDDNGQRQAWRTGQLFRNGYPASDVIVTFYMMAKFDADKLDNLWGCGNIKLLNGRFMETGIDGLPRNYLNPDDNYLER